MRRTCPPLAALGALGALAVLGAGCACGDDKVCRVDGGEYFAIFPDGWDGRTPLPVILSAHGYGGSPDSLLVRDDIRDPYSDGGVLWLVPEGADRSWATRNSPETDDGGHRDDVRFLGRVLDDAAERWSVDRSRVAASGFSQGASMASELGCLDPERWGVVMPVSGTFWQPVPASCAGEVPVRHTHGTLDPTWPLSGRAIGPFHQGAVGDAMATWASAAGCDPEPVPRSEAGRTCSVYTGCAGGEVRVCFHDGAHAFPSDEADLQLEWLGTLGWW